jgi:hypothetical protein
MRHQTVLRQMLICLVAGSLALALAHTGYSYYVLVCVRRGRHETDCPGKRLLCARDRHRRSTASKSRRVAAVIVDPM